MNRQGHPEVTKRATLGVRTLDTESRSFDVVASTDGLDSHGDKVAQDWKLDRFKANPVVFFGHESWDLPIGKASDVRVEDGELRARVTLVSAAANPRAEQVMQLMKEGALSGVSVGFRPGKVSTEKLDGREIVVLSQNELLELSVVGIPANPEARAKSDGRHGGGANEGTAMKNIVTKALDMSKDASDEAVEKALDTITKDILEATGAKALAGVPGAVEALKAKLAAQTEKADKFAALEAKLAEDEKVAKAAKLSATLDAAVKAGKVTPAKRADIAAKAEKFGQEWLDALVEDLPVLGGTEEDAEKSAAKASVVSAELKAELAKLNLTVDDHIKFGRPAA